ncbi:MAG: hypothetical protein ACJAUV_001221 [Flavobacteriales bacterium]|jgi:hypothetical protein
MLELCKKVLKGVSFDRILFKKELVKATKWVSQKDLFQLKAWCLATYGVVHGQVIEEVFNQIQ